MHKKGYTQSRAYKGQKQNYKRSQKQNKNGDISTLEFPNLNDMRPNSISGDSKNNNILTRYEKIQQTTFYKLARRSVFINSLRVSLVLLLIVAFFFCFVAPHNSFISLEASWEKIDQIKAQGISLNSFEANSIIFNNYDALVFSLEDNYAIIYNDVEYDNSYTFVFRPGSSLFHCSLERDSFNYYIEGWQFPVRFSFSEVFNIPQNINADNVIKVSGDFEYWSMYYDHGIGKDYNLSISGNRWGTSYMFLRNEPCSISVFSDSLTVDIYKENELVVEGEKVGNYSIKIPMMRGLRISTYGQGEMYLSKVKSCNIELENPTRISFTGSGTLQYYYTSEGKTDSFDNYDMEVESNGGYKGSLIMYDEKTTKLLGLLH